MSEHNVIVHTEDLVRIYPLGSKQVFALRGVNLEIPSGVFWALKGRSGSGKTTLLNCLGGLDKPTSGRVSVLGVEISTLNESQRTNWRRDHLGLVFQSFSLLPTLSAYENVELALRIRGGNLAARRARTLEVLNLVGLDRWKGHRPYEMSGGQQQRVAIARALANQAPLILADEPTGELDSNTSREILGLFRSLVKDHSVTVLVVSHDPIVDEYADQVLHLSDGQIVA